jgi:ComF family protein
MPGLCRACSLAPPPFERAVFSYLYRGRMREAIHALKYDRISPVAKRLGHMLAAAIAQLHGTAPNDLLVVPVPLHRRRSAERGFNQTRLLARSALASLRRTHPGWKLTLASRTLIRTRNTESQFSLTPRERRINVRRAFRVSAPTAVSGKHILLVDDILTTGATARAAALTLRRAGAESVWVATLSRARRDPGTNPGIFPQPTEISTGRPQTHDGAEPLATAGMFHTSSPSST